MGNCCRQQMDNPPEPNPPHALPKASSNFTFAKSRFSSDSTLKLPPTFSDPALFAVEQNDNSRDVIEHIQDISGEELP
ncbi:unnamed protein product [Blepharisma stoltei]|uniref:Uncharacterized protein n=1 Tax=Blepharisma stoltei TaxID=1481888 RepID=A0AAU9KDE7_9CILI|nr:unnamed protein product [Blepharisma stoltei]